MSGIPCMAAMEYLSLLTIMLNMAFLTEHHRNPPMQTNEAYVTVVRTSRKIKTQPCPAYELAVIET